MKPAGNLRSFVTFSQSKSFLIGYDVSQPKQEIEEIKQFGNELRSSGKEVFFLMYHGTKKLAQDIQNSLYYQNFCKADVNILGKPKSRELKQFLNREFDFFINGTLKEHKFFEMFARHTRSRFRIGKYFSASEDRYELMIQPNGVDECENFLIEIGKHIKLLR